MSAIRNFPPNVPWCDPKTGIPTQLAAGWMRSIFDFTGATTGSVPVGSLGGDGISGTLFYSAAGTFDIPDYPIGANPTVSLGLTANNGVATTFMRSDAAPALDVGISPTWTGNHTFNSVTCVNGFGCNGQAAQTEYTVNAALAATAGAAYTATEQGMLNDLKALVNQLRAALVANGVAV